MGGTFRVGSGTSQPHQNNSLDLPTGKMVTWKKRSKKSSRTQIAGDFLCPSKSIKPSITKQKNTNPRLWGKVEFLKNIFCSTEIAKSAPIWCPKKCGIVWNKIHWGPRRWEFVWSQLQPPKIPWKNRISYALKSSPKRRNKPKNGKRPAFFISFPPMFFTARHTQQKQELSKFRPAQICLVMVVGKMKVFLYQTVFFVLWWFSVPWSIESVKNISIKKQTPNQQRQTPKKQTANSRFADFWFSMGSNPYTPEV